MIAETEKKILNEKELGDIILCEPVTDRGRQALGELGLTKNDISEDFFFHKLHIKAKYIGNHDGCVENTSAQEGLMHPYNLTEALFNEKKEQYNIFCNKLVNDATHDVQLYIHGTPGVGKSIEANNLVRNPVRDGKALPSDNIVYNLERSQTELPHGDLFTVPGKPLWLICMKLIEKLFDHTIENIDKRTIIAENHNNFFRFHRSTDRQEEELFDYIKDYEGSAEQEKGLFKAIIGFYSEDDPEKSIENLLKIMMRLMYCVAPEKKHYLIFDNIEHYIDLNGQKIVIPNSVLSVLSSCVRDVIGNARLVYERIRTDEVWRAFKIILVIRRATAKMVEPDSAQFATRFTSGGHDYTGHFDIWEIWKSRKILVWENKLKDKYDPEQSGKVIELLDVIMHDYPAVVVGHSYQALISPLMNFGIRRNGRAQAHSAMELYGILSKNSKQYIDLEEFYKLIKKRSPNAIMYMFRRALLEFQYKWMITSNDSTERFKDLLLGELREPKSSFLKDKQGAPIIVRNVKYDEGSVTLVWRVLCYLSNCPDPNVKDMFETKSLYDLLEGVFVNPAQRDSRTKPSLDSKSHFLPLAKVLVSLGNMSHTQTKASPFLVLGIDDSRYHTNSDSDIFSEILKEIWEAGVAKREQYSKVHYGARLTTAGGVFVSDIQASFSFFAALFCSEEVPLFFLKDSVRIRKVIETVYTKAEILCTAYKNAANSFCPANFNLKTGKYMLMRGLEYVSFEKRVKELHIAHLKLYKEYLEVNYQDLDLGSDFKVITGHIQRYIEYYKSWKEDNKCF